MKLSGETARPARLEKVSTAPLRGERNRKLFGGKDTISVPINCHGRQTAIGVRSFSADTILGYVAHHFLNTW
ncbi:hypothetical protein TorRG33x02_052340 [Trema orientale]|uniref:Uncharacterized protein n=1 Tax=Trema orientale TaxID=63057 RepID=A0A2P5FMH1_TREOI|nr:hypothetical protein TorRG33x02_052340 [Trema orientale]